jgi:hypothetical protein
LAAIEANPSAQTSTQQTVGTELVPIDSQALALSPLSSPTFSQDLGHVTFSQSTLSHMTIAAAGLGHQQNSQSTMGGLTFTAMNQLGNTLLPVTSLSNGHCTTTGLPTIAYQLPAGMGAHALAYTQLNAGNMLPLQSNLASAQLSPVSAAFHNLCCPTPQSADPTAPIAIPYTPGNAMEFKSYTPAAMQLKSMPVLSYGGMTYFDPQMTKVKGGLALAAAANRYSPY